MSNLILINDENRCYGKNCVDFKPLEDGTLTGDTRYCNHSVECKQTDAKGVGFLSNWYWYYDYDTGEREFDYFCTGMYGDKDERTEDKEVS